MIKNGQYFAAGSTEHDDENKVFQCENLSSTLTHLPDPESTTKTETTDEPKSKVFKVDDAQRMETGETKGKYHEDVTHSIGDTANESQNLQFLSPTKDVIGKVQEIIKDRYCVLDIDLDFFSTKNPFKEMYGEEQYKILQELYHFNKPNSSLEEDLEKYVAERQKQLADLKAVFTALEQDPNTVIQHPKKDLIRRLVTELQSKNPVTIDYALVHEGGCTCDDTELPHHLSSNTQISVLVDCVQDILSHLRKPTLITAARSSIDDYCPPDQVDFIQEKVLEMLQDLYLQIEVSLAYETDDRA